MGTKVIFINGRFLSQPVTGVQRYAIELIRAIDGHLGESPALMQQFEFVLLVPPNLNQTPVFAYISVKQVGRLTGHLWEQMELPFYSRKGFLVGLCNTGPLLRRYQIITFHDASVYRVPEAYSRMFRFWYRAIFTIISHRIKGLLTVSQFSRDEIAACCGIQPQRITVTYNGIDHQRWGDKHESLYTDKTICIDKVRFAGRPFVLAVSSMSPHKNFRTLTEAVILLGKAGFDIVIAGGTNPAVFAGMDISLPKTVKHVGFVSDNELKSLYSQAACFIFPSLYEGFGLPPLEAMSNGCPVIAARAGSLPEVCGDAALYCDPKSPHDIADKINMMMGDAKLRDEFRAKGLLHAKQFTWEKCARETLFAIQKVLNQ